VRLNFNSPAQYNLGGGWGYPGSEIMLPLSPRHLLYTQVGNAHPPRRGEAMPRHQAVLLRQYIVEHAHRMIFCAAPDASIPIMRPRVISDTLLRDEQRQWEQWHEIQAAAERELMGW